MNAPGPGAAHSSGRGCLLWGGIGVAFVVLGLGAIVFWLATHSTQDPAEARAWAEEMIDLEFPAETPPASGLRLDDVRFVFAGEDVEDPSRLSLTVVGSASEQSLEFDQLARYGETDEDAEVKVLDRQELGFLVRGEEVRTMLVRYDNGTTDYSLLLEGKPAMEGRNWRVMLVFHGPPERNTAEWVQRALDGVR